MARQTYWIGPRPSDGKSWAYTTMATVLTDDEEKEAVYRMYQRYVKQWNDIELNNDKCISEHMHEICGAKVVGSNRRFTLHWYGGSEVHWILEVLFARGFKEHYPGLSCGRNALRSIKDIRAIRLHWSENGREEFSRWCAAEHVANHDNGEWSEYKA
ncbi:hypothetical protein [Pseudomonas coronafaciens]|uniref:hypothetical protein n=1 Tax=Pseudomonas coronafaciens TaxID=53409 RepID=UPI000E3C3E7E|nr:hypothetical protein [Pseudomonas coronafaciens]